MGAGLLSAWSVRRAQKCESSFISVLFPASLFETHSPKFYFMQYINIERKYQSCVHKLAFVQIRKHQHLAGLCLIHVRCPGGSFGIWRQGSFEHGQEKRQRPREVLWLSPQVMQMELHVRMRAGFCCLSFPDGSCVVSLEGLPWHFSEIAQLFGMITGNHHFSEIELCLSHDRLLPSPQLGGCTAGLLLTTYQILWTLKTTHLRELV